jgi:hypothetical protein
MAVTDSGSSTARDFPARRGIHSSFPGQPWRQVALADHLAQLFRDINVKGLLNDRNHNDIISFY